MTHANERRDAAHHQAGRADVQDLAGQDCDEPLSPWVIALYGYLLLVAPALFFLWVGGAKV